MKESETVLVLRAQRRCSSAFEGLMALYERPLLYFLRRQIGDLDRAMDVSQEVWLAVWRSLPRLRNASSFRSWLYHIAHQRAALLFRQTRHYERTNEPVNVDEEMSDFDPAGTLHIADLQRAIDRITPLQREVIVLYYIAGLPIEETAEVVGCAAGTVKSRLFHARKELKRILDGETDHA